MCKVSANIRTEAASPNSTPSRMLKGVTSVDIDRLRWGQVEREENSSSSLRFGVHYIRSGASHYTFVKACTLSFGIEWHQKLARSLHVPSKRMPRPKEVEASRSSQEERTLTATPQHPPTRSLPSHHLHPSLWKRRHPNSSFPSTITMFRTALRTGSRAAGALSSSTRVSAVCNTTPLARWSSNGLQLRWQRAQWHE